MPSIERYVDLVVAREARAADAAVRAATARMLRFRAWNDQDAVAELVAQLSDLAIAAAGTSAAGADAFLLSVAREHMGGSLGSSSVIDLGRPLRVGVGGWTDLYQRPVVKYRYLRSIGYPEDPALSAAIDQLDAMVRTDVALARRSQGRESLSALGYDHYRRVIRPYASKGGTCGLCVVAADRVYTTDRLLPIHSRCKCLVLPIVSAEFDPGLELNNADLGRIYDAADEEVARARERGRDIRTTGREALKATRVKVIDHPELGPVLEPVHRSAA